MIFLGFHFEILIFLGSTSDIFFSSPHFLCLKKDELRYRTAKSKGHEKRDRLLVSKVKFNYQITQRNKYVLIQFSKYKFLSQRVKYKLFVKFRELKGHIFFCKIRMLRFVQKTCQFFLFPCVHYSFPTVSWLCFWVLTRK